MTYSTCALSMNIFHINSIEWFVVPFLRENPPTHPNRFDLHFLSLFCSHIYPTPKLEPTPKSKPTPNTHYPQFLYNYQP